MKKTCFLLLPLLGIAMTTVTKAATVEYGSGHGDIGLAYEDGELELHYHFGDGALLDGSPLVGEIEYAPNEAHVRVGDNTSVATTADVSFLGTSSGDPVWILPQSNTSGMPFLGIAADELDATFLAATLQLSSFSGPGEFALWQNGGVGGSDVMMQTNDGLSLADTLDLTIGGHDHFNFGFTEEGVYDVGITAVGEFAAGGSVTDFGNFRFVVGSATAVPEPGAFAMLAFAFGAAIPLRRRRNVVTDEALPVNQD